MGPFELTDLNGQDVNLAVTKSVHAAYIGDARFTPSLIQQALVDAGRLGRRSGRGFYDYAEGAEAAVPDKEASAPRPEEIELWTACEPGRSIAQRLELAGISFMARTDSDREQRVLRAGATVVHLTNGRTATQRAADMGHPSTVQADLVLDAAAAHRIVLAAADTCDGAAFAAAVTVFQLAGFAVTGLDDVPGLAVMRTVAMLANEAADAVAEGVCDAPSVDTGMCLGVNYPLGPLAWAERVGLAYILAVLDNLASSYGEDGYRASPLLRRKVAAGHRFHS